MRMVYRQGVSALLPVGLVFLVLALLTSVSDARPPASGPLQDPTSTAVAEPTDIPPTPAAPPGTPEPAGPCLPGVASPRFAWTLYVAAQVGTGASAAPGMWAPFGDNAGPYLKAHVKALYGDVWYGATLNAATGRIEPDAHPAWPRPDLIRSAANGVQTTRTGNPMCGRSAEATLPPCYAELVVPLVFLDRLTTDGPYLRTTYFWVPSNQVEDDDGRPSRITVHEYSAASCDTRRLGPRIGSARPVYAQFSGCSSPSRRIDTCYVVGCGDLWIHCE